MIRVLIADDHTILRRGMHELLNVEPDIETVGEAESGKLALRFLDSNKVDVAVLDISMPGGSGLETLKEIRRLYPDTAVVVLSMHPKEQYAVRVLKSGASAYVTKESAPQELVRAIRKVYSGHRYIPPDVAELLADYVQQWNLEEPHRLLSDRELEVFSLIASGKSVTQIASELNLSVKTISTYKARIAEKTGLLTGSDMTRYAILHHLLVT